MVLESPDMAERGFRFCSDAAAATSAGYRAEAGH